MKEKRFDPNNLYKEAMDLPNAGGKKMYSSTPSETVQVDIRPDTNVSPAKFKPHPLLPGAYLAHPTTIAAMRKDIFVLGEELFEELETLYSCESCQNTVDVQFWHFCPYCERPFPEEILKVKD